MKAFFQLEEMPDVCANDAGNAACKRMQRNAEVLKSEPSPFDGQYRH